MPHNSSKKLVQADKLARSSSKQPSTGPENLIPSTDLNLSLTNLARLTDQSSTRMIVQRKVLDLHKNSTATVLPGSLFKIAYNGCR